MKDDYLDSPEVQEYKSGLNGIDIEAYLQRLGDGKKKTRGIPTNIEWIDEILGGIEKLNILAGRSGAGKTTLVSQIALSTAKKAQVIFYSLEMGMDEILTVMVQNICAQAEEEINGQIQALEYDDIVLRGNDEKLEDKKKKQLAEATKQLAKVAKNIHIKDETFRTPVVLSDKKNIYSIENDIKALREKHPKDEILVIVDSINDLVDMDGNIYSEETKGATALKTLANRENIGILAISQQNKASMNSKSMNNKQGSISGSANRVYKAQTVFEIVTPKELADWSEDMPSHKKKEIEEAVKSAESSSNENGARPMFLNVLKGRRVKVSHKPMKFYKKYSLFAKGSTSKRLANIPRGW